MTDSDEPEARRTDFLIEYYKVLWNNINRHIQGVWQTVTALGGSIALLALVGDNILPLSFAVTLIVGLCAWYAATAYDSALWFARNQLIATNIERLFLNDSDRNVIQQYFAEKPRDTLLISHFKIALWLSRGLVIVVLTYHFIEVVYPSFSIENAFDMKKAMPYVAFAIYVVVEVKSHSSGSESYNDLIRETGSSE